MKTCSSKILLAICTSFLFYNFSTAEEQQWPKMIQSPDTNIVIYQPQLEKFNANKLTARSVVSVTAGNSAEPVFGVLCFNAQVETDRDNRMVTLADINVNKVIFPDTLGEQKDKLDAVLKSEIPKWNLQMSLDEMLTSLELVEKEKKARDELNNNPPKILFSELPAVLVTFDGEPKLMKVENTNLMKAVNTPFFIVLDMPSKTYFLKAGDQWMKANDIKGPWRAAVTIPAAAAALAEDKDASTANGTVSTPQANGVDNLLQIIEATEPTELIATNGEPEFQIITGTNLLFISNTDSDVFMDINTQQIYVLLSGRWFTAKKKEGPWTYLYPDKLPSDFAKIPPGSDKGHVRAHIAGTEEAHEAVVETYIPQTAAVKRSEANLTVTYDGDPEFGPIQGTSMQYAVNTAYSVVLVDGRYYCCNDAVWFVADNQLGPWSVCTQVPQVIYTIPPSCPIYPVRYVYVYDSTPDIVYVGYTPGYFGCYPYHGCVVYGTGFYYTPWYGRFCYPRPRTWGFGFYYNDTIDCWGFEIGRRHGWFGTGFVTGGWWGHCVFRTDDFDVRHNAVVRINHDRFSNINNIYTRRRDSIVRTDFRIPQAASRLENHRNNFFSDRSGNIYHNTLNGWERHRPERQSWLGSENRPLLTERPAVRGQEVPQQRHEVTNNDSAQHRQELNQELRARDRAVERTNSFQQYRSAEDSRGGSRDVGGGRNEGSGRDVGGGRDIGGGRDAGGSRDAGDARYGGGHGGGGGRHGR
ncbi:MAG: hypothetical protein WAK60_09150 [Sedimentisphaerales bacterium]